MNHVGSLISFAFIYLTRRCCTVRVQLNNYAQHIYRVNDAVTFTQKQIGNLWNVECYSE